MTGDTRGFYHVPDLQLYREKEINDAAQNISCRILLRYTHTTGDVERQSSPGKHPDGRFPASLPLIQLDLQKKEIEDRRSSVKSPIRDVGNDDDDFVEIDEDYEIYDIVRYLVCFN